MADPERIVFLDTETTGLYVSQGHRIIEVAAIEARGRNLTGRQLHFYVNPEREIDDGALAIHGLSSEFLADKPVFGLIARELVDFIEGSCLHIHNAKFDVEFLDAEFSRLGMKPVSELDIEVVDMLAMARRRFLARGIHLMHSANDWV
jgi:exonuclease, DNA polymerase III, epsilon subunit family